MFKAVALSSRLLREWHLHIAYNMTEANAIQTILDMHATVADWRSKYPVGSRTSDSCLQPQIISEVTAHRRSHLDERPSTQTKDPRRSLNLLQNPQWPFYPLSLSPALKSNSAKNGMTSRIQNYSLIWISLVRCLSYRPVWYFGSKCRAQP